MHPWQEAKLNRIANEFMGTRRVTYTKTIGDCYQMLERLEEQGILYKYVHELGALLFDDDFWEYRRWSDEDIAQLAFVDPVRRCIALALTLEKEEACGR